MKAEDEKLIKSRETSTATVATNPLPETKGIDFQYQQAPFKYQPGSAVYDVFSQAKQQKQILQDEQARATRMAKIAAFTDFFKSLGNLAGQGYAPVPQQQTSPYFQRAFEQADQARRQQLQSDLQYNDLARKVQQEDYNQQLKYHQEAEKERNKYGYEAAKMKADQQFRAGVEGYRAGQQKVTQEYTDPTERDAKLDLAKRDTAAREMNAQTARLRATQQKKSDTEEKPFLIYNNKKMGISGAQQVINDLNDIYKRIENVPDNQLSPLEREVQSDLANMNRMMNSGDVEKSNNAIRYVALKYLAKDTKGQFNKYFLPETNQGNLIDDLIEEDERNYTTQPSLLR